jgi:hypothetical protein
MIFTPVANGESYPRCQLTSGRRASGGMRGLADLVDEQPEIDIVGPSSDDASLEEGDSADESSDEEDEEQPIVHGEM